MRRLADELGVSDRTIRTDISILTVDYPLETIRGNGGCVKIADWYHPNKGILSGEQQRVLYQMLEKGDAHQSKVLQELLDAYGSQKKIRR
jgi:predicted DNA-binding transcriptional regulator YafY